MEQARHDHLTFRGNDPRRRYGWLRLTPAYSIHVVEQLLAAPAESCARVLDPFCGTGTTALVCAERGISCVTTDINPFLIWLAKAKTRRYSERTLAAFAALASQVEQRLLSPTGHSHWRPALYQIEKWWEPSTLDALAGAWQLIEGSFDGEPKPVRDLLKLAFCQAMIGSAQVSFGHQSMSFRRALRAIRADPAQLFRSAVARLMASAASNIAKIPQVLACDARKLEAKLEPRSVGAVVTSPPYPNRMSYVRELRPYMYWLGYLVDGAAAGELDWKAIGGTWGTATSRVGRWEPTRHDQAPSPSLGPLLQQIALQSRLLSRYVHKYFCDMFRHLQSLSRVLEPGADLHYIVGNSKFYDVLVPVERVFAELFGVLGFEHVKVTPLRKRSSKRELFEFDVSARKPA